MATNKMNTRSRVCSPMLLDFLRSSGSRIGSTQPREDKVRRYLNEKVEALVSKIEIKGDILYQKKLTLSSITGSGPSVCMARLCADTYSSV
ncbi:unnamed protein product [Timema podura]|uniref:Uncharacterized protein n=1 Tax=Timema podura TaxID=61482 RepID=A0ABN7NGR9_TIMPD|nr:unnamed protein product [Timema podura]